MARRKGKKRRRGGGFRRAARGARRAGRRFRRRTGIKLGLLSKAGALIAAGPPVLFGALDGLRAFQAGTGDIMDRLTQASKTSLNSLAVGFGFAAPFTPSPVAVTPTSGLYRTTFTIGLTMIITDAIQSFVINFAARRGNRAVRFMGKALTTGR
jgi:hypothetical protein